MRLQLVVADDGSVTQVRVEWITDKAYAAAWTLMLLSFGYGVLHAAGPGHGKAVISAWLLATESPLLAAFWSR